MADFTIINGTAAELTNVNVGGVDIAPGAVTSGVTLTGAELLVVAALNGVAVMQDAPTAAEKDLVVDALVSSYDADFSGIAKVEALATAMAQDNTGQRIEALAALGLPESGLA